MIDPLPTEYSFADGCFCLLDVYRDEDRNWLSPSFPWGVAEHPLSPRIPACYEIIEILSDDGIISRLHRAR